MPRKQRTIRREKEVRGVGLHEGVEAALRVRPAPADSGVTFVRTDLASRPRIPARLENLAERRRRTALVGPADAEVHTVEHFLACCTALGIDNLEVELSGPECPGMDGSAKAFLDILEEAEPIEQDADRAVLAIGSPVIVDAGDGVSLVAFPASPASAASRAGAGGLGIAYSLDYGPAAPGTAVPAPQHFAARITPEVFRAEIAGARTFCLQAEADALRTQGLGKGATYENTLVIGAEGVVENELRWPNEFARHKALDLLGDLFLLGVDFEGHVAAYRSGHAANLRLVAALRAAASAKGPAQPTPRASSRPRVPEPAPAALDRAPVPLLAS